MKVNNPTIKAENKRKINKLIKELSNLLDNDKTTDIIDKEILKQYLPQSKYHK